MRRPATKKLAIRKGEARLRQADPVLASLIDKHGPCALAEYEYRPFHTLVVSIISQQLSAAAAETIKARIEAIVPTPFFPAAFLAAPPSALLKAGLSKAKLHYIHGLAADAVTGKISFMDLCYQDDATVITTLTNFPGIGPWTAEMFLIFGLQRLDVLSLGDAGLQRAARILYPSSRRHTSSLTAVAEPWRPYRSIASWYLWRFLDNEGQRDQRNRGDSGQQSGQYDIEDNHCRYSVSDRAHFDKSEVMPSD